MLEWQIKNLEEIAEVDRGKFSIRPRNDPRFFGGEMPFVQTGDVTSAGIYLNGFSQTLNAEGVKVSKVFPKNTILITIAANIGECCLTQFDVACPDSVVGIVPKSDKVDPYWLLLSLKTKKDDLESCATQNAQKNINLQVLKPLKLLTPPLNEQREIAKILSTWDKSIEATDRLLKNSVKRKKALMQKLLTGKKRLPGFDREWLKTSLSCIAKIEMGSSPSSNAYNDQGFGLPLVQGNADIKDRKSSPRVFTSEVTKEAYPGDILMSVRAPVGEVSISDHHCCIGRGVCSIKADESRVNQGFLFQLLLNLEPSWASISQGSTFESVNSKDVKNLQLSLPPLLEQTAIAEILATADAEIDLFARRAKSLKSEKTALMQQLLTGKRRVNLGDASA